MQKMCLMINKYGHPEQNNGDSLLLVVKNTIKNLLIKMPL